MQSIAKTIKVRAQPNKERTTMIYGNINAKETEAAYTPVIRKALDILRTTDVSEMHHGKSFLSG